MNHPEAILRTLDGHLLQPTTLILYGRAALALGFKNGSTGFHSTRDVAAILPESRMEAIDMDDQFWAAVEITNSDLESAGLYMTHLFSDSQVILSPDWLEKLEPVFLEGLKHLELFRPSTPDLILTKMMRVDPQDREDIIFLLSQTALTPHHLDGLLESAEIPDIPEIREAFETNAGWLRDKLAGN